MNIQHQYPLDQLNTLGFPATAEAFVSVTSEQMLIDAVHYADKQGLKLHILGGGSNILVTPNVAGLVIKMDMKGRTVNMSGDSALLTLGAGEEWHKTVAWSVAQGFSGIESMALIPGSVGAAPVQNIGAYGTELKDCFVHLRAYDIEQKRWVVFDKKACQFAYRDSLFKQQPGRYIITEVTLSLSKVAAPRLKYAALQGFFDQKGINAPSLSQIFDAVCEVRRSKLPDPATLGNAGSFFKNPVITNSQCDALISHFPDLVRYPDQPGYTKLAAGWLIDQCHWKGKRQGNVGVYDKQALVLVHYGDGQLGELLDLSEQIQTSVQSKFGVSLEREPQIFPLI